MGESLHEERRFGERFSSRVLVVNRSEAQFRLNLFVNGLIWVSESYTVSKQVVSSTYRREERRFEN